MVLTNEQFDNNCINVLNSFIQLYPETYAALWMMYKFGFRWIEVFQLSRWKDYNDNEYELDTAKKSNNRLIKKIEVIDSFKTLINSNDQIIMQFGYMSMRRYFKQYSFYSNLSVGNKPLALHSFRYNRARLMKEAGYSDNDIKNWFGEVEQSNMDRYIYSNIKA